MAESIMSEAQNDFAEEMRRPRRRSLADRLAQVLSGSFPVPVLDKNERELVAQHLEESARRALAHLVLLDARFFRMTLEEAAYDTPATAMLRSIAAAVRTGADRAEVVPGVNEPARYTLSGLLEAAQRRGEREGAPRGVAEACGQLRQAWDVWAKVSGSDIERAWHIALRPPLDRDVVMDHYQVGG